MLQNVVLVSLWRPECDLVECLIDGHDPHLLVVCVRLRLTNTNKDTIVDITFFLLCLLAKPYRSLFQNIFAHGILRLFHISSLFLLGLVAFHVDLLESVIVKA